MYMSLEHFNTLSILVKKKNNSRGICFICDTILQYRAYFHCLKELHEQYCHIQLHKAGRFIVCLEMFCKQRALWFQVLDLTSTARIKHAFYQSFQNQAVFCIYITSLLLLKVSFVTESERNSCY